MLTKFTVENFKTIKSLTLDLHADDYDFNEEAVKDGIVTTGMIYGKTGVGKSTLRDALLNITNTIQSRFYTLPYECLDHDSGKHGKHPHFVYEFIFGGKTVKYDYTIAVYNIVCRERLYVGDRLIVDRTLTDDPNPLEEDLSDFNVYIEGEKDTDWRQRVHQGRNFSLVYALLFPELFHNGEGSHIINDPDYNTLKAFCEFVCRMRGCGTAHDSPFNYNWRYRHCPSRAIVENDKADEFSKFLKACKLNGYSITMMPGEKTERTERSPELCMTTPYSKTAEPFDKTVSSGLRELALIYGAYLETVQEGSFTIIDNFGDRLSLGAGKACVKLFREVTDKQTLLISNNTDLISNDLLRPDCYFNMTEKKGNVTIKSFRKSTRKDIRFENNLQKMYKADFFE